MTVGTEQQIVVDKVTVGFRSSDKERRPRYSQMLLLCWFTLPSDSSIQYTGWVLLNRLTGTLALPIYFRQVSGPPPTEEFGWENIQHPEWVHAQCEKAARKFAGQLVANAR